MIAGIDYATPSVFESARERALIGMAANARRPVRFSGRLVRNIPIFRFALRALGEVVWSNDLWASEGEFGNILDPIITVHPDRIFFEVFSQDQSAYASLIVNRSFFETEGEVRTGTTNVDFTAWLWAALNELRSSRETWLRVDAAGFEVRTVKAGGRFEQKVNVPDAWVRGFLQLSSAMAMPGTKVSARAADLLSAIRFLRYTKARVSPRALRYEFAPGQDARLILEPWEHAVTLHGAEHNYTELRTIRTWGRRRLSLIEPLLPFANGVDIYLKGRALPSFYAVKLPEMTFLLGLSGWSDQSWTGTGSFDLLGDASSIDANLLPQVHQRLTEKFACSVEQLSKELGQPRETVMRACERLCRQGRAIFDVETREFRHRELFEQPIDDVKFFPPDVRVERAQSFILQNVVSVSGCEPQETRKVKNLKTPEGRITREIVYRDWKVTGTIADQKKVEIVVSDTARIIFGTCGCAFFNENFLNKGPCEHMIALLRASAEQRRDLPSSFQTNEVAPAGKAAMTTEDGDEDDLDETEEDSNDEDR